MFMEPDHFWGTKPNSKYFQKNEPVKQELTLIV